MLSIIKLRILGLRDEYLIFIIMTIMFLVLTAIFGTSMVNYRQTVTITDEDKSYYSQLFINEMKERTKFNYKISGYGESEALIEEGKAIAGVRIKKGFGEDINQGKTPSIDVLKVKDTADTIVFEGVLRDATKKMMGNILIANTTARYINSIKKDIDINNIRDRVYIVVIDSWKYRRPVITEGQFLGNHNMEGNDNLKHSVIGFSIFFSMYTIVFGIGTILNDREYNTWQRMIISPLSKTDILGGSLIVTFIVGFIQLGVLILAGKYIFNIDWGQSTLGILLIAGTFVFSVTSLGLLLSGLVKTHAQLAAISPVVLTSTAMLGGCMWPLEIVNSRILLILANFTPQKWAVEGMEKIATYGYGFEAAILPGIVLTLMGLIFFGIGVRLVKFE